MKRGMLMLVLCGGGIAVSGLALLFYVKAVPPRLASRNWPFIGKADNAGGSLLTGTHLRWMSTDVVTYFEACSAAEWQTTCHLTNPVDIWAAMRKKIDLYDREQSLIDSWGDTYYFTVTKRPDATVIRIGSKANDPALNGKHMFIDLEFDPARKVITRKQSWNSSVEIIAVPTKVDGWMLIPAPE